MRNFCAVVLAVSVLASSARAADGNAPLPPGRPASVKQAQQGGNTLYYIISFAVIAGGTALVALSGGSSTIATTGTA